jgi:hypothetical protein
MKIVQEVGSTRVEQDLYVGEARQITVDTDNWDLRLHDDVTPGGHVLMNRDNADARYQAKLAELSGFGGFAPELKGFWVRTAAGVMALRQITVNANEFTITNPQGVAGDPLIALKASISTAHTWTGVQTFTEAIVANLTGNTAGTHTGAVNGTHTGASNGTHTGAQVGSVDVRGATLQLDDDQIPQSKVNGLAAALSALGVFSGVIWLYGGLVADIPAGWSVCDGTNGTPDLRNKFVYGCAADADVGVTGGVTSHTHGFSMTTTGAHTHGITVDNTTLTILQMPAHFHGSGVCDQGTPTWANHGTIAANPTSADSVANDDETGTAEAKTTTEGGGQPHAHTASSASAGGHTHVGTVESTSMLPPYMKLIYIMKD